MLAACAPAAPVVGPALPAPAEPAVPSVPDQPACDPHTADSSFEQEPIYVQITAYQTALEARAVASRGWTRLGRAQTSPQLGDVRDAGDGILIDAKGQRWLKTRARYICTHDDPAFYVDRRGGVFEATFAPTCGTTRKITLCAVEAGEGCGRDPGKPPPEYWYAPVAPDAHWLGVPEVLMRDAVATCFDLRPAMTTYPP